MISLAQYYALIPQPTVPVPAGPPDAVDSDRTSPRQAALYRLSGDLNPLHIDPQMAAMGGFDKPILHGLCSLGYAGRHVLRRFAQNDPERVRAMKVCTFISTPLTGKARFTAPVFPGETIETSMWLRGSRVHIQARVVERDVWVLRDGYVDLVADNASPVAPQNSLKVPIILLKWTILF
jgi:acyl dehydratase